MSWRNFFKRTNTIAKAQANDALDKIEDPVVMTKEAIRTLSEKLESAYEAQAKIRAQEIRLRSQYVKLDDDAKAWMKKANLLQDKLDAGELNSDTAETMLVEALNKVENAQNEAKKIKLSADKQGEVVSKIEGKIKDLREMINEAKSELSNLEVRATTAKVTADVNKELNDIGSADSARDLIERMKSKVEEDEALAQAYEDVGDAGKTLSEEIDKVLEEDSPTANASLLADFRKGRKPATKPAAKSSKPKSSAKKK